MFERFTTAARAAVVEAQSEARLLGHRHIGTEHLLLGLLAARACAAGTGRDAARDLLQDAGIDTARVRAEITRIGRSGGLDESDAAALESIGIDLGAVRARLEETFGPGALDPPPEWKVRRGLFWRRGGAASGFLPFTPRAKKVLELSLRESLRLGHNYISCEHVLLGLLRDGGGLGAKILADAGIDVDELRRQTVSRLGRAA